jgi:flavin reductase (DIM6/NTAB) family NADH-FMN oxidoreductase RutF
MSEKELFGGLELLRPPVITAAKMPRAAIIPVVIDDETGYINAAPYSGAVINTDPIHVLFGVKSQNSIDTYRTADEFCISIPSREQIDYMWVMSLVVPKGIDEIELAGWHNINSKIISTPGIEECLINLECKKIHFHELPYPWRALVVGEVVGVSMSSEIINKNRSETIKILPMHESGAHAETAIYGQSVMTGELVSLSDSKQRELKENSTDTDTPERKIFASQRDLLEPENMKIRANAILPRPCYIVSTKGQGGGVISTPIIGGMMGSAPPGVQIPLPKNSETIRNIEDTGVFVVSIPDRSVLSSYEDMLKDNKEERKLVGFTRLTPHMVDVPGFVECPVNIDCKLISIDNVFESNYSLIVGRRVGISLDREIYRQLNVRIPNFASLSFANEFYSRLIYSVFDDFMEIKWGFHDVNLISVRPLPSYGSRHGAWWGYDRYPSIKLWLLELIEEGLITEREINKIANAVKLWNNGHGPTHLSEYFDDKTRYELRKKLANLFQMMAWAHRDLNKWDEVREYICTFPPVERDQHHGPLFHDKWYDLKIKSGLPLGGGFVW